MNWILYADEALVIVNKPAGLLAVPGRGADKADCASARVQALWPDALVVHRLDMATSGLLMLARGAGAQRRLSEAFARRHVDKRYVALVQGLPAQEAGSVNLPLGADWPRRPLQRVDHEQGRPATTHWRRLPTPEAAGVARLELTPVTGRSHQLRVHLAASGWPILGDALYGDPASAPRLMLHASRLAFAHPQHGGPMVFDCPPPF